MKFQLTGGEIYNVPAAPQTNFQLLYIKVLDPPLSSSSFSGCLFFLSLKYSSRFCSHGRLQACPLQRSLLRRSTRAPTVPQPPPQAYYRPSRGHSSCGFCCIIGTLLKLIITIVVIIGIAALVIWLVLRPTAIKFYVENASLTQFNFTNTNTLHYELRLNVSITNHNKKIGIEYDNLEAAAYYAGERFGWDQLPGFYQGHKNTTILQTAFKGQSLIVPADFVANVFNDQKARGFYYVDVKIKPKMRFKIGHLKTTKYSPKIWCYLQIPLDSKNSSSTAAGGFTRTKCDVDY